MANSWGKIEEGCSNCGGIVEWFNFGADCRGNKSSSGANCLSGCVWSEEQTKAFWSDLFAKQRAEFDAQVKRGEWDA